MTRTPDEIMIGMECCITDNCKGCPYYPLYEVFGCKLERAKDAIHLIQQLQDENAKKDETIQMLQDGNASLMRMIDEECEKTVKLEAERDAAVKDLLIGPTCETCMHHDKGRNDSPCDACVENTIDHSGLHWQWRGVQKGE